jgi:SNF2 family DNA or RNA helicase
MRRRERGDDEPRGGLCADQMGLGKTIMTLANIINGRKAKDEPGPKTTLIVATPALVTQWFSEIEKHCERKFTGQVLKYFGKFKLVTGDDAEAVSSFDIVLTTYNEVRRSFPKIEFPVELQTTEEKNRWWTQYYHENRGLLHQIDFFRIVLDEAQAIKNHKSWTSIAARELSAEHRWALSGTPIQNSVSELYPYFKFLKVPHTGTFKIFSHNYTSADGPNERGFDRLQLMLSRFMIRRTHADKILGHQIITLPKATQNFHECTFSELERVIYETVRIRMIQRINRLSRSKQLDRNYSCILTMLLRLRQLTCHSLMLEKAMQDLLTREDHEKLFELANEAANKPTSLSRDELVKLRILLDREQGFNRSITTATRKFATSSVNLNENDEEVDQEDDENGGGPSATGRSGYVGHQHGLKFQFLKYLATLRVNKKWEELQDRTLCAKCNDQPEQPYVTSCFHVYCYSCLELLQAEAASRDMTKARCLECGIEYTGSKECDNYDLSGQMGVDSDSDDDDAEGLKAHRMARNKRLGSKKESKDWIDMAGTDILPSAKTIAIKAQILNWIEENPNVKIILYTQFIDMIRIVCGLPPSLPSPIY